LFLKSRHGRKFLKAFRIKSYPAENGKQVPWQEDKHVASASASSYSPLTTFFYLKKEIVVV
jgi:hypothetical protein